MSPLAAAPAWGQYAPVTGAAADHDRLDAWCARELGSAPLRMIFAAGHLAPVIGVELDDGRQVVIKVRQSPERVRAVVSVQRHLFKAGFPCPEPLVGPAPFDTRVATAETYVPSRPANGTPSVGACAELFAELVEKAPGPGGFPVLRVAPPWVGWDHPNPLLWPVPDDLDCDLNAVPAAGWLDEAAARVRRRLRGDTGKPIVGHVDWEAHNLGWRDGEPVVVYDWDSLAIRAEAALAGAAAAVFTSSGATVAATVAQTQEFLDHYQRRRGRWEASDRELAWAAGLWVLLYNAKKETAGGGTGYLHHLESELSRRMSRTGA